MKIPNLFIRNYKKPLKDFMPFSTSILPLVKLMLLGLKLTTSETLSPQ